MQKNIPLLPYWLCLVLFVIALALPNSSTFAARKHSSKRHTIKRASFKLKSTDSNLSNPSRIVIVSLANV